MRRLLLFAMMCVCASIGAWAADFEWTSSDGQQYKVTASDVQVGNSNTYQKLVVNKAGALAAFVEATKGDANNVLMGVGGNASRVNLQIEGPLNSDDFSALNSTEVAPWGTFTSLDLTNAEIADASVITGSEMKMGNVKYLRLPSNFQSTTEMANLSSQMPDLEMALSFSDLETTTPKVFIHSYKSNSRVAAFAALNCEATLNNAVYATLSGDYGDDDLIAHNGNLPFLKAAVWDFTGASFDPCTVDATVVNRGPYYASTDPFQEYGTVTLSANYPSNAFYYFYNYSKSVVSIKLPTEITELPPISLSYLGEGNKDNYKLVYGLTDAEIEEIQSQYSSISGYQAWVPIETLVIPDNIVTVGWECCVQSVIKSVELGTGVKEVQGGAFKLNRVLDNLDCKTGISDCRLGDQAFNECNNMKHIVLSEGIISLGANCFNNSQNLESIRLPETLAEIGNYCFKDGHALSSITIPATVQKIGMGAFTLTALTDVYLMAEDPADVPIIYTAGSDWGDVKSTFSKNTMESNNTLNWDGTGNFGGKTTKKVNEMTFDEAAAAYFAYCNRMAALHFSPKIADVVLSEISSYYGCTSTDGYGIPVMQTDDSGKRGNAMGLQNMGGTGSDGGIYTKYGWAQFLIQKEFTPDHPEVFTKEYDDVWYTMCFPFDLTDEQMAGAFNEGFNIVDFSGVEIQDKTQSDDGKQKLILHFNTVAKTTYKDTEDNIYTVIGREKDGKFEYNIYKLGNDTYHHVGVGSESEQYKTKTFAKDGNADNGVVEIDGILASAGHPYMVHPNTGTNTGMPLTRCHFSGITWKPENTWETIFDAEKRVVDLSEARGNMNTGEPDEDNYLQAAYNYNGTYTFVGNPKALKDGAPEEPTDRYQSYPPYPTLESYPTEPSLERGDEPQAPADPTSTVGARKTEADAPTRVDNPADDTETYPMAFQELFNKVRCTGYDYSVSPAIEVNYTFGEDLINGTFSEFFWGQVGNPGDPVRYADHANLHSYISCDYTALESYLGSADQDDIQDRFNALKTLATNFANAKPAYDAYLVELQAYQDNIDAWNQYDIDYAKYQSDHDAWLNWTAEGASAAHDAWEQECDEIDERNAPLVSQYNTDCANVDRYNRGIKEEWEASLNAYKRLIPKGAYFLGRRGRGWPKYFRETADEDRENPTGGFWTQYTAIVIPNDDAKNGIENELDGKTASSKGFDMAFDEGFLGDVIEQDDVVTLIEKAQEDGADVKYMDIVVSINGQVVRRGSTSLEGLPKGMYIINGKKYLVK